MLPLNLGPACFAAADLRETRFYAVNLDSADFSAARLDRAEFHHNSLRLADFSNAQLCAAIFRHSHLPQAIWHQAQTYRTQFQFCADAPPALPQALYAPASLEQLPSSQRLALLTGHQGQINACAYAPDGSRLLSAGGDGTLRLWDAVSGACLRIHAVIGGEQGGYAVWSPVDNRVIAAAGEAWRWLAWTDGRGSRWPLESFGALPDGMQDRKSDGLRAG